ncbi:MAG: hypothetical protein QOH97_5286 [Actinoplanes sp.]|nr:hypothetical protein [Actinoplanes sp.]
MRPDEVNPVVPAGLSDLILRLLEKEPDRRYQSAAGLVHDLVRMRGDHVRGGPDRFVLGLRDFPLRLAAPSRPVGRDGEIAVLREAFEDAMSGHCHGVLVSGGAGVGKSCLIDELRPVVATCGGWFVSGKFDQYREDVDSDGVQQVLRRLCQLLLAEPDSELVDLQSRLTEALGSNAVVLAAMVPEFAALIGSPGGGAGLADLRVNRDQLVQMVLDFLYSVATLARPVVLVLDDLQWAGPAAVALLDAVLNEPHRTGLLLVGAYRDAEVDVAHPLTAMLARWRESGTAVRWIRLRNLPVADLGVLLADMLRLPMERAVRLAEVVAVRTGGNPYDSVELLNALRREGTLMPGPQGWQWDPAAVRQHLGRCDVLELLIARINALPAQTGTVLQIMACLGGEMTMDLLVAASGHSRQVLAERLLPALEDGLLVMERSGRAGGVVRFRHDRVQQAAFARLASPARAALQLDLGRRLVAVVSLRAVAAEQYLCAVALISGRAERHRAAALFHETAKGLQVLQPEMAERLTHAAVDLLQGDPADLDVVLVTAAQTSRHAALFALGRLDDADVVYEAIKRQCPDPLGRVVAACVQITSLTNRNRVDEALALGLDLLARLGLPLPEMDAIGPVIGQGMAALTAWAAGPDKNDDLYRPEVDDPRVLAISALMKQVIPAAFAGNPAIMAWLLVEAQRLWVTHGPCEALVHVLGLTGFAASAAQQDYHTGYAVGRHLIAISEAHAYEAGAPHIWATFTGNAAPWFEPLEDVLRDVHRAREGLLRVGDLQVAGYIHNVTTTALLDIGPTLTVLLAEVESGLAFCRRTGHQLMAEFLLPLRQLVRALRGQTDAPDSLNDVPDSPSDVDSPTDVPFNETTHLAGLTANGLAQGIFQISRAIAAAVNGNTPQLIESADAAKRLMPMFPGLYVTAIAYLVRGLAVAQQVSAAAPGERAGPLAELDACRAWLAARAADAPANFAHLSLFLDAERAWAIGDTWTAHCAFDAALHDNPGHPRPWHRALTAERAALFHLAHGLQHTGHALLAEARHGYAAWGATGKTRQLDDQYPGLAIPSVQRPEPSRIQTIDTGRSGSISSDAIDLLGVLKASQALSSETNLDLLRARVGEVLSAMTGATTVQVLLRDDEANRWQLADPAGQPGATVTLEEGAARGLLPISVIRYTERTREPLLIDDAAHDDRFSRDPYFTGVACCALMVAPILAQGQPRAMLLLESRLTHSAFTTERLDAVHLIAGQLAVSLDNALLYASLERKVVERTDALARANQRLEQLAITDALTGLPNRRRLDEILDTEWHRALRPKTPLAVAIIDIDHFKLYNDHYGHPAGDRCLHQVAAALAGNVRETDFVARYGGEEFCLVMPDTHIAGAVIAAERVRIAVNELAEPHQASTHGFVTISIGVASVIPTAYDTLEDLIRHADTHLYEAKRGGRNRTTSQTPD